MQAVACAKKRAKKSDGVDVKVVSSLSMAASVLLRCWNLCLSPLAYHLSILLLHEGAAKKVDNCCTNLLFVKN